MTSYGWDDQVRVKNWFTGAGHPIEQFETSDEYWLRHSQVQQLVNAMAAFDPPASGESVLPDDRRAQLEPVLAASWEFSQ
jgi:hypothetical protein